MKAMRVLSGALVALAAPLLPFWIGTSPRRESSVFVLPHDFAGPYDAEGDDSMWLHREDFGSLVRYSQGEWEPVRGDAMARLLLLRFRAVGTSRDQALARLAQLPERWGATFEPVGPDEIRMTLFPRERDLSAFVSAVHEACGASLDLGQARYSSWPRIDARIVLRLRPDGRLPDESVSPRRVTPSIEVRNFFSESTKNKPLPPSVLEIEAVGDDHVSIRTRHGTRIMLNPIATACPGVFNLARLRSEPVPSRVGGEERVVHLRVRVGFPYATAGVIHKLSPLGQEMADWGFVAEPEPETGHVLVQLVDSPEDLTRVLTRLRAVSGQEVDEAPVHRRSRPRMDTRWTVPVIQGSRLPNGRLLVVRGLSAAEAVRGYLTRLPWKGALTGLAPAVEIVDDHHIAFRTRSVVSASQDAIEEALKMLSDAIPGVFDSAEVRVEQKLTVLLNRTGRDAATASDCVRTVQELHRRGDLGRYPGLARGISPEPWIVYRVDPSARFRDATPLKGVQAARYVALLLRLLHLGLSPRDPRFAERGRIPASPGELERFLSETEGKAPTIPVRVLDDSRVAFRDSGTARRFDEATAALRLGIFSAERTEMVFRTSRLDYGVVEGCSVPLAGPHVQESGRRWIQLRGFEPRSADEVGDPETALREGRAAAAFVADPPGDLPSVDLGLRAVLAALFHCGKLSAKTRRDLARALDDATGPLSIREIRILCRRHRRVSREQAMWMADRWRSSGAHPVVEAEPDSIFRRRISTGDFDVVVDAFPATICTEPERWWRTRAARNVSRLSDPDLDTVLGRLGCTFDLRKREELLADVHAGLASLVAWHSFGRVAVRLCGTREGLRRLGLPEPQSR